MGAKTDILLAIAEIRAKRAAALAEFDSDISALERAAAVLSRHEVVPAMAQPPSLPVVLKDVPKVASVAPALPGTGNKPADIAGLVLVTLSNGPVWRTLPELCRGIQAGGVVIGGKDPVGNLSTILSRHKEAMGFVGHKRRGWALAARVNGHDALASGGDMGYVAAKAA